MFDRVLNEPLKNYYICLLIIVTIRIFIGIDGSLLSQVTEEDLKQHPINMTLGLHRRILIENIKNLKEKLPNHPTGFWEYKVKLTDRT